MHERLPSQTAALVAMWRALADDGFTSAHGFSDPVAKELLPPLWRGFYRRARTWLARASAERRAQVLATVDVMPLRVLAIDAELDAAVTAGCRQVVILGAGLDTRAFRLPALAGCDVFEVDHPATQAYKRRRAGSLPRRARSLTYVTVDFEKDDLVARLAESGHRADVPTAWVWEGVVMYLSLEALRTSLAAIARSSAPGSRVIVNYHTPDGPEQTAGERRLRRFLLALVREPQIGLRSPETMRAEVTRAGLEVRHDSGTAAWAERFGAGALRGGTARVARLLVATRP
jgi:methyltransferase (TIGR00027 family)